LDLLADVAALNALIEPLILAHLEQWFFLDDALE
jgi:lauroyl/myristoyl acyltransferase